MPNKVLASRFNSLKTATDRLLGPCLETNRNSGDYIFGYGTTLSTYPVQSSTNDLIDADAYQKLYLDIAKARIHQVGTSGFTPVAYKIGDYLTNPATADKIEEAYVTDLETLSSTMVTDKFVCHPSQADLLACDASTTASTWNGTKNHIFTVTFTNAQKRREYFNAGGQIRFVPSMTYAGSQGKTIDWKTMLNAIGTVSFGCQGTFGSGGVGQSYGGIGHDYMTNSYQTAYYNQGGGVYSPNRYTLYAMELNDYTLQFKGEFSDPSYGNPDEEVLAAAHHDTFFFRPNGTATILGTSYTTVQSELPTSTTIATL